MKKLSDVRPEGSSYGISLTKLAGVPIADVIGYISNEFGEPVFKVTKILFEDGTTTHVDGEHDIAYLSAFGENAPPSLVDETISDLYRQQEQ